MMRVLILLLFACSLTAEPMSDRHRDLFLAALWRAEGGHKARQHFGILAVPVRDYVHARRIAAKAVDRVHAKWVRDNRRGCIISRFCDAWCPRQTDATGNSNLKRNMRKMLRGVDFRYR